MKTIAQIALAILVFTLVVIIKHQLASDKRLDRLEKHYHDFVEVQGTNVPIIKVKP